MAINRKMIALAGVSMIFGSAYANIKLPAIFSDGMVLQQQANVPVWGTADGETVYVTTSWNDKKYHVQVDDQGAWRLMIKTHEAGGPYEIYLDDGKKVKLSDVLIGEVCVASGQSNM